MERDEIEALIKCGALDDCGASRPALLWQLDLMRSSFPPANAPPAQSAEMLFPDAALPAPSAAVATPPADHTREQRLAYEQEILEVCVSGHPLDRVTRNGEVWSNELERLRGKRATLLGWVVTFRHVGTKDYRNMMFVTLEDQHGLYEAVLFPEAYERYGGLVFETRLLRVTGRVEPDGQINCQKLEAVRT